MVLVPSGKTRLMVAQNLSTPSAEGYDGMSISDEGKGPLSLDNSKLQTDPSPVLNTEKAMDDDLGEDNTTTNDDMSINSTEEQKLSPKENRKTLTSYIFEKLQSYGYPGRRLQEFKSEFVKESVSPEGVKDIEVVIPDKKYPDEKGFTDTIENEELKEIAHEINQTFGLNFNGAERATGKWTIKFTSANITSPDEQSISHDTLDQVYGKPDKGNRPEQKHPVSGKSPVKASTIGEMIKESKNKIVKNLQKILGE